MRSKSKCRQDDVAQSACARLQMNASALRRCAVRVVREYGEAPPVTGDRQKLLQTVVNRVRNANHAMRDVDTSSRCVTIRVTTDARPSGYVAPGGPLKWTRAND